jgi:hypothetical protein
VGKRSILDQNYIEQWSMPEPNSGCWLWMSRLSTNGYGLILNGPRHKRTPIQAHRLSYGLYKGPIEPGLCVCHRCDTKACVNPDHLYLGTHQRNMDDAAKNGLMGRALNIEQVKEIARLFAAGASNRQVADIFGVAMSTVQRIRNGETWHHTTRNALEQQRRPARRAAA